MPSWFEPFLTAQGLIALTTLFLLEVVLGIDNVVFIAVLSGKLPPEQRLRASRVGIMLAVVSRILLLLAIQWLLSLSKFKLFTVPFGGETAHQFSVKDLVILLGGLFLLFKATTEIHGKVSGDHLPVDPSRPGAKAAATFGSVILQIVMIDIVFSIDSVITAAGMSKDIPIMVAAVVLSAVVMLTFAGPIMSFVNKHPTVKVLALAFLVLIGTMLVAESFGVHVPKGYIYFAMAFSLGVELLNMKLRAKTGRHAPEPVERAPADGQAPLV